MQWTAFAPHVRRLSQKDQERVRQAFAFSEKLHDGQLRKSGEPYFIHPATVALRLADSGADRDTVIAALLHDTVEDTPITLDEIETQYGSDVRSLIDGVTKLEAAQFAAQPNLDEQIETLRKIFTLMREDLRIVVIKLYDRLHNMETVDFLPPEKKRALAQETLDIFVRIADRLSMQELRDELEALCIAALDPDRHRRLLALRDKETENNQFAIGAIREKIFDRHPDFSGKVKMHFESKSWETLGHQLETGDSVVSGLPAATVIFICDNRDLCYRVMGALHEPWKREVLSFQDFINFPTLNGYRGLHTTIILESGMRVRCKIRTREMQDYARMGVTLYCFDAERRKKLPELLPWTQRISSLAEDTKDRSQDFWQSLQNDILGETITIYGPDDADARLPKNATALDGAFFLFGDNALQLQSVKMDGKDVDLRAPLTHVATLDPTFAEEPTVQRDWLKWAQTSHATAMIRNFFTEQSQEERAAIGKNMLQAVLSERKKGFLEEFNEDILLKEAKRIGFSTMTDLFLAIADGRLEPVRVYADLFEKRKNARNQNSVNYLVQYNVDMDDVPTMDALNKIHRKFGDHLHEIRYRRGKRGKLGMVWLKLTLPKNDQEALMEELTTAGAQGVDCIVHTRRELVLMASVIVLWALNPVLAKWLLFEGMTMPALLTIRFLVFGAFTILFFVVWKIFHRQKFAPIPRLPALAILPTLGNALNSALTYLALTIVPPSLHLTILRFNSLLLPSVARPRKSGTSRIPLELFFFLLVLASAVFILIAGNRLIPGILLSVLTLVSYTFYSLSTERTLHAHRIEVRYPFLLFYTGLAFGMIGLCLAAFLHSADLLNALTLPAIGYVILCVCIPHTCYTALLKTMRFRFFTDLQILEVPLAVLFEMIILGISMPAAIYLAMVGILASLFFARRKTMMFSLE